MSVQRRGRPLSELGAGAHFGEMALVNDAPRSATVVALDEMNLLVIGRTEMMGLMRVDPVLAVKILWTLVQSLSSRLRVTSAEQIEIAEAPPGHGARAVSAPGMKAPTLGDDRRRFAAGRGTLHLAPMRAGH